MALDFDSKHPHDPKEVFGASARGERGEGMNNPEQPENEADMTSEGALFKPFYATGATEEEGEEISAERREKVRVLSKDERLDKEKDGGDKASISEAEGNKGAGLKVPGSSDYEETMWGRLVTRRLGITDYGDFMRIEGKGKKNPQTGEREISDKQLSRLIKKAVLEKGWTKDLTIMNNGRIDQNLTMRAKQIYAEQMARPGGSCEGIQVNFAETLPDELPPTAKGAPLGGLGHAMRKREERKAAERAAKKSAKADKESSAGTRRRAAEEEADADQTEDDVNEADSLEDIGVGEDDHSAATGAEESVAETPAEDIPSEDPHRAPPPPPGFSTGPG